MKHTTSKSYYYKRRISAYWGSLSCNTPKTIRHSGLQVPYLLNTFHDNCYLSFGEPQVFESINLVNVVIMTNFHLKQNVPR